MFIQIINTKNTKKPLKIVEIDYCCSYSYYSQLLIKIEKKSLDQPKNLIFILKILKLRTTSEWGGWVKKKE